MPTARARRQRLFLAWTGISLTWAASVVLEILLLRDAAPAAVIVTTTIAVIIGAQLTRRILTPQRRGAITVEDLHGRRMRSR
jgi:membrane protein implicated in regulation of membrane protease activity